MEFRNDVPPATADGAAALGRCLFSFLLAADRREFMAKIRIKKKTCSEIRRLALRLSQNDSDAYEPWCLVWQPTLRKMAKWIATPRLYWRWRDSNNVDDLVGVGNEVLAEVAVELMTGVRPELEKPVGYVWTCIRWRMTDAIRNQWAGSEKFGYMYKTSQPDEDKIRFESIEAKDHRLPKDHTDFNKLEFDEEVAAVVSDDDDQRIVDAAQIVGRKNYSAIEEITGINRKRVKKRMDIMEEQLIRRLYHRETVLAGGVTLPDRDDADEYGWEIEESISA